MFSTKTYYVGYVLNVQCNDICIMKEETKS